MTAKIWFIATLLLTGCAGGNGQRPAEPGYLEQAEQALDAIEHYAQLLEQRVDSGYTSSADSLSAMALALGICDSVKHIQRNWKALKPPKAIVRSYVLIDSVMSYQWLRAIHFTGIHAWADRGYPELAAYESQLERQYAVSTAELLRRARESLRALEGKRPVRPRESAMCSPLSSRI